MFLQQFTNWFTHYDKWVHQAERAERLGMAWEQKDEMTGCTYHSLAELDQKAEEIKALYKEEKEKQRQRQAEYIKALRQGGAK